MPQLGFESCAVECIAMGKKSLHCTFKQQDIFKYLLSLYLLAPQLVNKMLGFDMKDDPQMLSFIKET